MQCELCVSIKANAKSEYSPKIVTHKQIKAHKTRKIHIKSTITRVGSSEIRIETRKIER